MYAIPNDESELKNLTGSGRANAGITNTAVPTCLGSVHLCGDRFCTCSILIFSIDVVPFSDAQMRRCADCVVVVVVGVGVAGRAGGQGGAPSR